MKREGFSTIETAGSTPVIISSKSSTLKSLKSLLTKSRIEEIYSFTSLEWETDCDKIINDILENFDSSKIIVSVF